MQLSVPKTDRVNVDLDSYKLNSEVHTYIIILQGGFYFALSFIHIVSYLFLHTPSFSLFLTLEIPASEQ